MVRRNTEKDAGRERGVVELELCRRVRREKRVRKRGQHTDTQAEGRSTLEGGKSIRGSWGGGGGEVGK